MTCPHCKGELNRGKAPFHADRAGCHVQWDAVPAWVCAQCGEALFDGEEVAAIQQALAAVEAQSRRLAGAR